MILDIKLAKKRYGEEIPFHFLAESDKLDLRAMVKMPIKADITGALIYTGEDYIVKGNIETDLEMECDRCSDSFRDHLVIPFEEEYTSQFDDEHWERNLLQGDYIDLKELIEDNILLYLSNKKLCKPDCKGLCPICGTNRNRQDCACNKE